MARKGIVLIDVDRKYLQGRIPVVESFEPGLEAGSSPQDPFDSCL